MHNTVAFVHQRTLKRPITCKGIALHSGHKVSMTLKPGAESTGIIFKRTDVASDIGEIPATWDRVVDTRLCTMLGNEHGVTLSTVEHLMAALAGCGIDNAEIEVNGPEIPVMDGSAEPFVVLIESAGVVEQDAPRRVIRVLKTITIQDGDSTATLRPASHLSLDVAIDFDNKVISQQNLNVGLVNGAFSKELSRARTFGFLHEVEQLRKVGLAQGGSLDNAIVVSGDSIMNEDGLRFDDEFVRHKILDAVGDLYLAGGSLIAAFSGSKVGHASNNTLLKALFSDDDAWTYDDLQGEEMSSAIDGGITAELRVAAE